MTIVTKTPTRSHVPQDKPRHFGRTVTVAAMLSLGAASLAGPAVAADAQNAPEQSTPSSANTLPTPSSKAPHADTGTTGGALKMAPSGMTSTLDGSLIGKPVFSQDGDEIGTVADIVMVNGQARLISIAHGGLLGIGQKYAEVDVRSVSVSNDGVVVQMTADQVAALPDVGAPMEQTD